MKKQIFSDIIKDNPVVYVVGGNANDYYIKVVTNELSRFLVDNNYTMIWGNSTTAREDETNVVALLAKSIVELGGNAPIQLIQDGESFVVSAVLEENSVSGKDKRLQKIVDETDSLLGYEDLACNDGKGRLIHANKSLSKPKLYYSNADIVLNLDGSYEVGCEIVSQLLYKLSGDINKDASIVTVDYNGKFRDLINSYIKMSTDVSTQNAAREILKNNYYYHIDELKYNIRNNNSLKKPFGLPKKL